MNNTDYMTRIEQAIRDRIHADVLAVIQSETFDRSDYWERIYFVAWERPEQCGTHRVNLDSNGEFMVESGNYQMDYAEAIRDAIERAGLVVK